MLLSLHSRLIAGALSLGVVAALVAAVVALSVSSGGPGASAQPAVVVMTTFADLAPATGEPTLSSLDSLHPSPGAVVPADGPFDDRFELGALAFDGSAVRGTVTITSDVSELLELEVVAGFYGADGTLLGTGRYVRQDAGHTHTHSVTPTKGAAGSEGATGEAFEIAVPAGLPQQAVSVGVGVPVLVNE